MCWKNTAVWGSSLRCTAKGGVLVCLNPEAPEEDSLLLMAHLDTLGAMVAEIGGDGRLRLTNLGGMNPNNAETENVRVDTRKPGGGRHAAAEERIRPRQRRLRHHQPYLRHHRSGAGRRREKYAGYPQAGH